MADEGGKAEKPKPQSPLPAPTAEADSVGGGTQAGTGVSAVFDERRDAADKAVYRMTEGAQGTPPLGQLKAQRSAPVHAALARMMRKPTTAGGSPSPAKIPTGSGQPLPTSVREKLEPQLGAELSTARIHTDSDSAHAAEKLGARAFTVGKDVHFGASEYNPDSKEGTKLLTHELVHVKQGENSTLQRKATNPDEDQDGDRQEAGHEVSQPGDPAEQEADAISDKVSDALEAPPSEEKDKEKSPGASPNQPKAAAPPIAAKLHDSVIFRMPKVGADHDEDAEKDKGQGKDRRKPGSLGQPKGTDALRQENKVVRDVVVELKLDKDQAQKLHMAISGQGLDYHAIKAMAQSMFPKIGKAK